MEKTTYTPGHTQNATHFMAQRNLESHGEFFKPYLKPDLQILDVGCGPGSITLGLAEIASEGQVTGIDFAASQIELAKAQTESAKIKNVEFQTGSCYELPFEDGMFDRVFSHALMEHLTEPHKAIQEFKRVLKPGGIIGLCSPDADGWMLAPVSEELNLAAQAYISLQDSNGGNLRVGKKLGNYLDQSGFEKVQVQARYENFQPLELIGEYLAVQLEKADQTEHAETFRNWYSSSYGMFAQSWISAVGTKA